MKKRIFLSLAASAIAFVVLFAVFCPQVKYEAVSAKGNCVFKATATEGIALTGTKNADGTLIGSESAPCIIEYSLPEGVSSKSVAIKFKNAETAVSLVTVESSADKTFVDKSPISASCLMGENTIYAELDEDITSIRVWFKQSCHLESVGFFDDIPSKTAKNYPIALSSYFITVLGAIAVFVISFLLDKKFSLFNKITDFLKERKRRLLMLFAGVGGCMLLAALAEFVLRFIIGPDSAGRRFSTASFGIFALVLLIIFIFIFERKAIALKPERAVAFIILAVGMFIIFTEPFSHNSSDEDSHYYWAVNNSFADKALLSDADYRVKMTNGFFLKDAHSTVASLEKVDSMNADDQYITRVQDVYFSLPHVPSGIFIAVARLFGASFRTKFIFGQMPMLFIYAALCYFAIKKLKIGKTILSVIALFPTSVLLACNFSYDPWVTGFAMLGTAYFINELRQPDKEMRVRDTIIMCTAFMLAALPKQVYLGLFVLPLFLIKNYKTKKQKRMYYLIVAIFFAITILSFAMRSASSLGGSGDIRGGAVNPSEQLSFILHNPFTYLKSLLKLFVTYFSPLYANRYITFFSYLGQGRFTFIFLLALLFCALTDKSPADRFKGMHLIKALSILIMLGTVCLIATAMYISFTPVGYDTINGCNPRYLIPLLAPLILTVFNPGITKLRKYKSYNIAVLIPVTLCLVYNTVSVITVPML